MEVLWGAWVRSVEYDEDGLPSRIEGIYEYVHKENKGDFPFITTLRVILCFEAPLSEFNKTLVMQLEIWDVDAGKICTLDVDVTIPGNYMDVRWYDDFEFENVEFREAGYYQLSVLVYGEVRRHVPLYITDGKTEIWGGKDDVELKIWPEDLGKWRDKI